MLPNIPTLSIPDHFPPPSKSFARFLRAVHSSPSFSIFYTIMLVVCCTSIVLNFIIDPDTNGKIYKGHVFLQFSEVLTNFLIVSEILLRIYSRHDCDSCSASIVVDIFLLILCTGSTVVFLNEDFSEFVGYTTCDSLFIFRSILYIIRITIMKQFGKNSELEGLKERLFEVDEEGLRRRLESAKIRYKYRPSMAILQEEDEEESDGEGFIIKI